MNTEQPFPAAPFAVVVNDDPTQLAVLAGLVRKANLEPLAFVSAEDALVEMLSRAAGAGGSSPSLPALVVTDLYMPGIDGWRFCRLLRSPEYASLNRLPILVVSATFSGDEPESIAADLGAEGFLAAPVDGSCFVKRVQEILTGKKMSKPLRALIVENSRELADTLKKTFGAHGYQAEGASTCREALDRFTKTAYDVAVVAYHLPDAFGDTIIEAVHKSRPDCVFIMMTYDQNPALALDWTKKGAAAYLHKPFEPEYLIDLCARARRERALLRTQDLLAERTRELQESELAQKTILRTALDGFWLVDTRGNILEVNGAYCRMSGYSEQELLSMKISDLEAVEVSDDVDDHSRRIAAQGEDRFESRHRRKDGTIFDVEVSVQYRPVSGGRFVVFLRDITDRKRAEQSLVDSERRWRNILVNIPQIGISLDREGRIIFANNHFLQLTRWQEEEVIGREWFEMFIPEAIRDEIRRVFLSVVQANDASAVGSYENEIVTRDGELRNIAWSNVLTMDVRGDIQDITSLGIDLTERKHAEEELRRSEERLRLALNGADLGIWDWNVQSGLATFNERWATMVGYALDEIEPHFSSWEKLVHPDDLPVVMAALNDHLFQITGSFESEFRMRHKSGKWIWVLSRGQVIERDILQRPLRACGTHLDITGRKRAEEDKAKLEAQLSQAQKMESVGRLAGGVAHDFNNMLGVILGRTELALRQTDPAGRLFAHLQEIKKAAERSADLTRQLLAFARKQTITPKALNLNESLEGMLKMLGRLIGEDIELVWLPASAPCPVKLDPSQLDQILANLCVNARDAIEGVGKVTIETGNAVFDADQCALHPGCVPGDYVVLSVSDNGCGMDKDILDRVFDPFFTTKEMGKGTGLGLATVYGIVRQNEGFINVYSEPGSGTTFKIYFPRYKGKEEQLREAGLSSPPVKGSETILVVEDEPANLEMATAMLEALGYQVLSAATPGESLRLAEKYAGEIDLLVTDVIMPEMDGRDLAKNLLALYPNMKRLFMSGYTADVIARSGVLDPGIHFIQKPFSMKDIADKIREALADFEDK